MAKKTYLFTVERESGHEVLSAEVETAKPSDVEAQRLPDGSVRLLEAGKAVAFGTAIVDQDEPLTLRRRPAGDPKARVTSKPVADANGEDQ